MIIPDSIYLNKEKLKQGELEVAIGMNDEIDEATLELLYHEFVDSDIVKESLEEASRKAKEVGYQEGYLDCSIENRREEDAD